MSTLVKTIKVSKDQDLKTRVAEAYNGVSAFTLLDMNQHSVDAFDKCLWIESIQYTSFHHMNSIVLCKWKRKVFIAHAI